MPVGGKRPGAGRKKGGKNRKSREIADKAAAEGITPLEYMLAVMRDDNADKSRRDEMARAAAPYMHPRLNAIEHSGKIDLSLAERLDAARRRRLGAARHISGDDR